MEEQESGFKRRFVTRWFMTWFVSMTLMILGVGEWYGNNEFTETFRELLGENLPAEIVHPVNSFLENTDAQKLEALASNDRIDPRALRPVIVGGQNDRVPFFDKKHSPDSYPPYGIKSVPLQPGSDRPKNHPDTAGPDVLPPDKEPLKIIQVDPSVGRPYVKDSDSPPPPQVGPLEEPQDLEKFSQVSENPKKPTMTPTASGLLVATNTPTEQPSSTPTLMPTATESPIPSETPTAVPSGTSTPQPTATNTLLPLWTSTATQKPKPTKEDPTPPPGR